MVNSRPGHFSAIPSSSQGKPDHRTRLPFFRSYGVNLPSSLTRAHSSTLGFSPHLPVSVCGTVIQMAPYEAFLDSVGSTSLRPCGLPITSRGYASMDFPVETPYRLRSGIPAPDWSTLLCPPFGQTPPGWYPDFNGFPITYAFRPQLRGRLTLSGLTFLRKP